MNNEVFTASNGLQIRHRGAAGLAYRDPTFGWTEVRGHTSESDVAVALTEYFRHKEDERLGRWRLPQNPDYVVYSKKSSLLEPTPGVRVVHEATGRSKDLGRSVIGACDATLSMFGMAAKDYFEAHPEKKPWHDAQQNELWELQIKDCCGPEVYRFAAETKFGPRAFRPVNNPSRVCFTPLNPIIESARRIWPESKETTND